MSDEAAAVEAARAAVERRGDLVKKLDDGDPLALLSLLEEAGGKIAGPVSVRVEHPAKEPIAEAG